MKTNLTPSLPPAHHGDLEAGGAFIKALIGSIASVSDATCDSLDENGPDALDGRDYLDMAERIRSALLRLADSSEAFQLGACRALADVLADAADGEAFGAEWDPLAASAPAYVRLRLGRIGRDTRHGL